MVASKDHVVFSSSLFTNTKSSTASVRLADTVNIIRNSMTDTDYGIYYDALLYKTNTKQQQTSGNVSVTITFPCGGSTASEVFFIDVL